MPTFNDPARNDGFVPESVIRRSIKMGTKRHVLTASLGAHATVAIGERIN